MAAPLAPTPDPQHRPAASSPFLSPGRFPGVLRLSSWSVEARVVLAGVLFFVLSVAASDEEGIVLCPFRRCTGGYCPGCGTTRAAGRLLRGDIVGSWQRHPFVVLGAAQLIVLGSIRLSGSNRLRSTVRRFATPLLAANAAVVLGIWVIRLATGQIPVPFG